MKEMTLLLPAFNEEATIGSVIDEAIMHGISKENILIGNNNSTDNTWNIAESKGVSIINVQHRGKSYVVNELIRHIKTPYAMILDSDGTYPLDGNIEKIHELLAVQHYDAVLTYRKKLSKDSMPVLHRIGNNGLSALFSIMYMRYVKDVLSGMWAFKTDLVKNIHIGKGGFITEVDFVYGVVSNKAKMKQIPIPYLPRPKDSAAKIRIHDGLVIAKRMLEWRFRKKEILSEEHYEVTMEAMRLPLK
jgi:dolichol-phosphate hexosyltransferase